MVATARSVAGPVAAAGSSAGGMRPGEDSEQSLYRELREEIGLEPGDVSIVARTERWLRYRLPARYVRRNGRPVCVGQKQRWFLLRLECEDARIRFDLTSEPEFDRGRWVDFWQPVREVIYFKRPVYTRAARTGTPRLPEGPASVSGLVAGTAMPGPEPRMDIPGKLIIRTYAPVRRWLVLLVLALLGCSLYLAYELGHYQAGFTASRRPRSARRCGPTRTHRRQSSVCRWLPQPRSRRAGARAGRGADMASCRLTGASGRNWIYRGLALPQGAAAGAAPVRVQQFQIAARDAAARQYVLRFSLNRLVRPEEPIAGQLAIVIDGERNASAASIDLATLTGGAASLVPFNFRYFSSVEQPITLPASERTPGHCVPRSSRSVAETRPHSQHVRTQADLRLHRHPDGVARRIGRYRCAGGLPSTAASTARARWRSRASTV
jgi:putative (di)nucleoside polyphosphate hydrolase